MVVHDFGDLLDKTEERGKKISSITHRLEDELVMLGEFLDNLSTRRPRGIVFNYITSNYAKFLSLIFIYTYKFITLYKNLS